MSVAPRQLKLLGFFLMKRAFFFIDGFNFYHSVNHPYLYRYKWLNYYKLASILKRHEDDIKKVILFTAYADWDPKKIARHKLLIKALETERVEVVLGRFKYKDCKCKKCYASYTQPVEKQTDVNIAVNLIKYAVKDEFDTAYIVSGDTDLIPAIKSFKELFPLKKVCVVFPLSRKGEELKSVCDFHIKIKQKHLQACLFPDPVLLPDGTSLSCPTNWK